VPLHHSLVECASHQSLLEAFPCPSMLWGVALHPPSPAGFFIYISLGEVPLPYSPAERASPQLLLEAFPNPRVVMTHLPSLAGLFIYSLLGEVLLPHSLTGGPCCLSASVGSLPLYKHAEGGYVTPTFSGRLVYL
jgi:hypothetical protein